MLNDFITYLEAEKRFSEHTVLAYQNDLEQFFDFSMVNCYSDVKEVNASLVRSWIVDLVEQEYSNSSINRKFSSLRTFFKWLNANGIIQANPTSIVKPPKNDKSPPSFAQESELAVEKIDKLFSDDFEGVRDRLMFELLYQTGIRLSELINLFKSNVSQQQIKVVGKRNKERIVPITKELSALINEYKKHLSESNIESEYLLVLNNGEKLYPKFVYRKINSYLGKTTGLKRKSPHVLRHTFATHMLNNGAELEVLKEILGHSNLSATQVYTHNSFAHLTSIYSQSHPRGLKK